MNIIDILASRTSIEGVANLMILFIYKLYFSLLKKEPHHPWNPMFKQTKPYSAKPLRVRTVPNSPVDEYRVFTKKFNFQICCWIFFVRAYHYYQNPTSLTILEKYDTFSAKMLDFFGNPSQVRSWFEPNDDSWNNGDGCMAYSIWAIVMWDERTNAS